MIYLLEDRIDRKNQFLDDSDKYPLLCQKAFECSSERDIEIYIKENYSDAQVVLLHKSYVFKDKSSITPELVKEKFQILFKVPVILFSGGSNSNLIKENGLITAEINSGVMYKNLPLFHHTYQESGFVNIPELVYGENYKMNQLLEMQAKINNYFFDRKGSDTLNDSIVEDIKDITDAITDTAIVGYLNKMWEWIDGKISSSDTPRIDTLTSLIQRLINLQ